MAIAARVAYLVDILLIGNGTNITMLSLIIC
jgi:hypothetical protein